MSALENKKIVTDIMAELARGNARPFGEAMAEDCIWRQMGKQGRWSVAYAGKQDSGENLFAPLRRQYATPYTNTLTHIFADGDTVIVESRGSVTLTNGKSYANLYCFVIQMHEGKMREVREYLDTALADASIEAFDI